MRLPNGNHAVVDVEKIRDYCLNPEHFHGRDKARVFRSALGLTQRDAVVLRERLLRAARDGEATLGAEDEFGVRFSVDFEMVWASRRAVLRSGWIIRTGEQVPRLTTCFVR